MIHPLSLISFTSFVILVHFSITVLRSNPRGHLNRAFSAMSLCWSIIAFSYTFMYTPGGEQQLGFWKNIAALGWFTVPGMTLHATFFLTKRGRLGNRPWMYPLMHLPAIVLLVNEIWGSTPALGHIVVSFGGPPFPYDSPFWFISFATVSFLYFTASLSMILHWMLTANSTNEKYQALMIMLGGTPILAVGTFTDAVFPLLGIGLTPPLAPVLILFWLAGLWTAFVRYNLMEITPSMVNKKVLKSFDTYQTLLENFTDIIWTMDMKLNLSFVSKSVQVLLGYTPREMMGMSYDKYVTPESFQLSMEILAAELEKEGKPGTDPNRSNKLDIEYVKKDGTTLWAEVHVKFIRSDDAVTGLLGISRDVSQRRRAEDRLRLSEEKYRQMVEHAGDVIYQTDRHGVFTYINPTVERILEYGWDDMVGKNFIEFVPRQYREGINRFYAEQYLSRTPDSYVEMPLHSRDGSVKWMGQNVRLLYEGDRITGFHGIARDITDRKSVEDQLRLRTEVIERDLSNAQHIQQALLPASPPRWENLAVDFRFIPMEKIGGDFFSFTVLQEGGLGVFIGDVSGHGVSAALFLSLLKSDTDQTCRACGTQPARFMERLSNILSVDMPRNFVTATYGIFQKDPETGIINFNFTNGGHPLPVLHSRKTSETKLVGKHGPLPGKFSGVSYSETSISLQRGDRIFLYTDGIPECRDEADHYLGFEELPDIVRASTRENLGDTLDAILNHCRSFCGPLSQEDDIVLIAFEVL